MTLTELIRSLNGQHIIGKDGKRYVIEIPSKTCIGTIYVTDVEDRSRYGFLSDLRDLGTTIYAGEDAEFMMVYGQGLYKKLIKMISELVPAGTSYRPGIRNGNDQDRLLKYVAENEGQLSANNALEETCVGHVFLASEFSDVQIFYKNKDGISEGIKALQRFHTDREKGIYTTSSGTELFLIGTKKPKPYLNN